MKNLKFSLGETLQHYGVCDASASVALDENRFLVANDEDNILQVYSANESGKPLGKGIDTNSYFPDKDPKDEVDIEGAAELNGIIYWISSHGRNKKNKFKPERHQFFANKITNLSPPTLSLVGKSYSQLVLKDMLNAKHLKKYNLQDAEKIAPKEKGGLNIEGLTTTPDGELLIGFRNPIHKDKALLLPLKNPADLIQENNSELTASFGEMIELDLGNRGIRSIEYWQTYQVYLIVAGAYDGSDNFTLYWWTGNHPPQEITSFPLPDQFRPESVLFYPNRPNQFQLLSDDGTIERPGEGGKMCKKIGDKNDPDYCHKYFRSVWITVSDK